MLDRTITLPIGPGADWSSFEWPSKDPSDILDYAIDATAWLSDAGLSISGTPSVLASPGVQAGILNVSGGIINLAIGGGTPSTTAQVAVSFLTSGSNILNVVVALPIRAGAAGLVATTVPIPPSAISTTYTASGAIALTDTYSLINSVSPVNMTLAAGSIDGQPIAVATIGAGVATLTVASLIGATSVALTMPQGAVVNLKWSASLSTYLYAS